MRSCAMLPLLLLQKVTITFALSKCKGRRTVFEFNRSLEQTVQIRRSRKLSPYVRARVFNLRWQRRGIHPDAARANRIGTDSED
jgi:hypothetical protein